VRCSEVAVSDVHDMGWVKYAYFSTPEPLTCKWLLAYGAGVADVYRALDDETRRLILDELVRQDGQTLFALCSVLTTHHGLGSTRQAISQHLAVLESAGLVTTARRGRTKLHYFNAEPLHVIAERWRLPGRREDTP